jgi:malate/lactate dehydrogenase
MRSKITVLGENKVVTRMLSEDDWVRVAGEDDLAGSHVVVVAEGVDAVDAGARVARRAAGAVVIVATADPKAGVAAVLEGSLLPRGRVLGLHGDLVRVAAEAIVLGRDTTLEGAVHVRGELGIEDAVSVVPLVVGRGGVRRIGP